MSTERRENRLGFGVAITAHGGEDGTVMERYGDELDQC
jgi:hypothetical protein